MSQFDFRTKDGSQWSYYVVDNLVTMTNIYRYDTVQEAIDKYMSLPGNLRSAIGSSIDGCHEIDHIHKVDGQSVLVRDMDNIDLPLWRDSLEICEAVQLMRNQLHVEYELSNMFYSHHGSVAIPVTEPFSHNSYFSNKRLSPKDPDHVLSGINEVFTVGEGWTKGEAFFDYLQNRQWSPDSGYPIPFINQLNIRYVDNKGSLGQADITPKHFIAMRYEYFREKRNASLDGKIAGAEQRASQHPGETKEMTAPER